MALREKKSEAIRMRKEGASYSQIKEKIKEYGDKWYQENKDRLAFHRMVRRYAFPEIQLDYRKRKKDDIKNYLQPLIK